MGKQKNKTRNAKNALPATVAIATGDNVHIKQHCNHPAIAIIDDADRLASVGREIVSMRIIGENVIYLSLAIVQSTIRSMAGSFANNGNGATQTHTAIRAIQTDSERFSRRRVIIICTKRNNYGSLDGLPAHNDATKYVTFEPRWDYFMHF